MAIERKEAFIFGGGPKTLVGPALQGGAAPRFTVSNNAGEAIDPMAATAGKVRIVLAVPSLDTGVCDRETRTFNERASQVPSAEILVISMDLPFAQKRWCGAAGVERVTTYSDHRDADFGAKYGVLIKEHRLLARAAWVVDKNDQIVYAEYLGAAKEEPNYDAVLAAAKQASV